MRYRTRDEGKTARSRAALCSDSTRVDRPRRKQIVVLPVRTSPLIARVIGPSTRHERTRNGRLYLFLEKGVVTGLRSAVVACVLTAAECDCAAREHDVRCALFEVRWRNGRSAMVPGPQAWEEAGSAARRGVAWRGEPLRETRRNKPVVGRSEARPGEKKRRAARRSRSPWRTCMYARDVRAPTRSALLCSARLGSTSRHVCVPSYAYNSALARSLASSVLYDERARQSRSTRAKGIDGAAAKPPEPLFHRSHVRAKRCYTIDEDTGSRPRAHIQFCAYTRAIREREGERERERERGHVRDKRRRESKRVRTMYTRYGSMTYYEWEDGGARDETHMQGRNRTLDALIQTSHVSSCFVLFRLLLYFRAQFYIY